MAEWARIAATTIADYASGYEDELIGKRILLAAIKSNGNIIRNCGGAGNSGDAGDFTWQVPYRQASLAVDDMETPVTPTRQDRWKRAGLSYIGYRMSDMMTKREKLRNKGRQALVDIFKEMAPRLMDDAGQQFSKELYVNSAGTGNSQRISGIETLFPTSGTFDLTATTAVSRTSNNADVAGYPSGTYAGLTITAGNYGGSWTVGTAGISYQWPNNKGDMQYDFFTPLVINYTSTAFTGATHTWADQCVEASRFAIINSQRYATNRRALRTMLMEREMYRVYLNKLDSKERLIASDNNRMAKLGFEDTFSQDGVDISWEIDMPAATAYLYDIDNIKLRTCQQDIFYVDGPWYERIQRCYPVIVDFYGQLQFNSPRFFAKLAPQSAIT